MTGKNKELWEKLHQLQYLLQRTRFRRRCGRPTADATRGQGRILAFLKMQDEIRTKDLAYLLDMGLSSLNELLAKLERNGYITREPSEQDKRVMLIKLTEKGRAEEQPEEDSDGIFSVLTAEEQAAFGAYLDRILTALESQLDQEGYPGDCNRRHQRNEARNRFYNGESPFRGSPHQRRGNNRFGGFRGGNGFGHGSPPDSPK